MRERPSHYVMAAAILIAGLIAAAAGLVHAAQGAWGWIGGMW